MPEIDRQQAEGQRVAFRADAAFARPEIYKALEARCVEYAIRIPANNLELAIGDLCVSGAPVDEHATAHISWTPLPYCGLSSPRRSLPTARLLASRHGIHVATAEGHEVQPRRQEHSIRSSRFRVGCGQSQEAKSEMSGLRISDLHL